MEYEDGRSLKMVLSEHSMPLKMATAIMKVRPVDRETSELTMAMEFVVKGGPIGWLMGFFLMRPMMKGVFTKVLSGLAYHAATGERIGKELPEKAKLSSVLAS